MNTWVIMFANIGNNTGLFADYETIQGKTAMEALKAKFNREFQRLTGDMGRYANIILVKGSYDKSSNTLHYKGRYQSLCYGIKDVTQRHYANYAA